MVGQARSGFAMNIVGQSSESSAAAGSRSHSHTTKRLNAFHEDEDDDDDEDDGLQRLHRNGGPYSNGRGKNRADEMLSGYSQSRGAEKVKRSPPRQGPRIIAKQADLNWMEERKRRLGLEKYRNQLGNLSSMRMPEGNSNLASSSSESSQKAQAAERIGDEKQLSGLQIQKKKEKSREKEELKEIQSLQENAKRQNGNQEDHTPPASQAGESPKPENQSKEEIEDEAARLALLSGQGLGSTFRIEEERIIPISEEEALKMDTDTRPEPPSLSDYAKMPVEEFGAALLRGMGWKEGMGAGKNRQGPTSAPEIKKRAALLGLGAKERKIDNDDDQRKSKNFRVERPERKYVPLTRIERENGNGSHGSASFSPAPGQRRLQYRERSRSPSRKRERDEVYDRREDREKSHRRDRDYSDDYERERERMKRREREREGERDRHYHSSSSDRRR